MLNSSEQPFSPLIFYILSFYYAPIAAKCIFWYNRGKTTVLLQHFPESNICYAVEFRKLYSACITNNFRKFDFFWFSTQKTKKAEVIIPWFIIIRFLYDNSVWVNIQIPICSTVFAEAACMKLHDIRHETVLHVTSFDENCHGCHAIFRKNLIIYTNLFLLEY